VEKNVVTGQQLGLLGGPLYTTYKVLGAIHYAHEINGNHIYWLESNDADFSEINHIDYLDANSELRTLTWDIDSQGYSCGLIEIDSLLSRSSTNFLIRCAKPNLRRLCVNSSYAVMFRDIP
jgi:uncharacterized protein YllA (UPF0747 family)